MIGILLFRL